MLYQAIGQLDQSAVSRPFRTTPTARGRRNLLSCDAAGRLLKPRRRSIARKARSLRR